MTLEVHLDAAELGPLRRVGFIHKSFARGDAPISFEYDRDWLASGAAFMLDPRLDLFSGEQHSPPPRSFGILTDSAPDRWGKVLMERREGARAAQEHRAPRTLHEIDFLLGVQDLTRTGALRFFDPGRQVYLDDGEPGVPPVTDLRELARVSSRLEEPGIEKLPELERLLAVLIAPGSSLGGARPKANFKEGRALWIAKFPSRGDRYDVGGWEYLVHRLASASKVEVPEANLARLSEQYRTFRVRRFDRRGAARRMFSSAMTLLEKADGESASYLDLAQFISDQGARDHIEEDLEQLFRRVLFNVVVGNRDDHLRNHGFIRDSTGWRLAPAYDLNPNPFRAEHVLTLDGSSAAPDVPTVMRTAELYRVEETAASRIRGEVERAVSRWKKEAAKLDLGRDEIARMAAVFES